MAVIGGDAATRAAVGATTIRAWRPDDGAAAPPWAGPTPTGNAGEVVGSGGPLSTPPPILGHQPKDQLSRGPTVGRGNVVFRALAAASAIAVFVAAVSAMPTHSAAAQVGRGRDMESTGVRSLSSPGRADEPFAIPEGLLPPLDGHDGRDLERIDRLVSRGRMARARRRLRSLVDRQPAAAAPAAKLFALLMPPPDQLDAIVLQRVGDDARLVAQGLGRVLRPPSPDRAALAAILTRQHAYALALAGDHQTAIRSAILAAGRNDRRAATLLGALATVSVLRMDLAAAETALAAACHMAPEDAELAHALGLLLLRRGQAERAVAALLTARRLAPDSPDIARGLAGALLAAGRSAEAVALLRRIESTICDAPARCALDTARAALEANAHDECLAAAQRSIAASPNGDPEAYLVMATALQMLRRTDDAAQAFGSALRLSPHDLRARAGLEALGQRPPP